MPERRSLFSYGVNVSTEQSRLARQFISDDKRCERWLFGRNELSLALSKILDVDGFTDDFADIKTWNGRAVCKPEDLPNTSIIVNCVINSKPRTAQQRLAKMNVYGKLTYMELHNDAPELIPLPEFVLLSRSEFDLNYLKLMRLYDSLADEVSRRVMVDVWRYRLTGEIESLADYAYRPSDQYFEDFHRLRSGEIFVDIGAFDGDTTEQFCTRYPDYEKVYVFEPSQSNIAKARERLHRFLRLEFIAEGVSDATAALKFNPDAGSASNITDAGTSLINVTTLDHKISGKVTFVKMDIEGWELKALAGARGHIEHDCPALAVAVYHVPSHFWEIFELVTALNPDYDVYLRHYSESWTETVMYFIPNRKNHTSRKDD